MEFLFILFMKLFVILTQMVPSDNYIRHSMDIARRTEANATN